jgi:MFS family permease
MNIAPQKQHLRTFGWASFLNDFGSDMIYPLWPIFLTSVLGAPMTVVGLIDGLGDAIVSISQAVSGYFSDKIKKRKLFIWIGYLCAGIARMGYALAPTWQWIIPFRALDRAGKMRGSPRNALIAEMSTTQDRGANFGYLRMMDNAGAVCGVLFTILFFSHLGYTAIFLIAAVPSIIGAVLILTKTKEEAGDTKIFKGLSLKDAHPQLILFFILSAIFALSAFSYSFLLVYAKQIGFAVTTIPVLYLLYTAVASLTSIPFGKLADRVPRKAVLGLSFLLWLFVCVALITFKTPIGVICAFILYGLHLGAIEPVQKALVSEFSSPELRASTLGAFQMVIGLVALPSSFIAGLLWTNMSVTAPFYFSAILVLIAIFLLLFVKSPKTA